ncbi:putative transcription factor interactor and regulator CCHC(Zn) family [Helianthus annuus]|nr:putative transcription factor interactor and regulator CCHC(Zn) family [Helianthus annuus]
MAKVYPRNPISQLPDHRSTSDHVNELPHNHDSVKKPTYAAFNRGGGGRRGCCFRCGEPGHFIRECPVPAPSSRTNNTWR